MIKYYESKPKNKKTNKLVNKHIFKHQFNENLKALSIWTGVATFLVLLVIGIFPLVKDLMAELFDNPTPEILTILDAFGIENFSSITGYFAAEAAQMYVLIGAIFSAILGVNLIKKELEYGSSEFLYAQPVKRSSIYITKLLTLVVNILIFNVAITLFSFSAMLLVEGGFTFNYTNLLLYFIATTIIHLQIGIITFSISAIFKRKISIGVGLGFAVMQYFIALISQIVTKVEPLKHLSTFTYVLDGVIVEGISAINTLTFVVWSMVTLLLVIISYVNFKTSDLL